MWNLTTTRETLVVDVNSVIYKYIPRNARIQEAVNSGHTIAGPLNH